MSPSAPHDDVPTPGPTTRPASEPASGPGQGLFTLDELTRRVGLTVRNVRFYTTKGLVPPPLRRGRSGYYTPEHVARFELIQELQSHGYTLAAIEKYLDRIPAEASVEDLAMHRTMLAPWQSEPPFELTLEQLRERSGRDLTETDLSTLEALAVLRPAGPGRYRVTVSQLSIGLGLLDLGFPREAAEAAAKVFEAHGRAIAEELQSLFRTMVWPAYREAGASPQRIREVVERLKPLTVASLVAAYEQGMEDAQRGSLEDRARRAR